MKQSLQIIFILLCTVLQPWLIEALTYCKRNNECSHDEYCDHIWKVCKCSQGFVNPTETKLGCLRIKEIGEICQHDVQCHQNKNLGLVCEDYRCSCSNNRLPLSGKCSSLTFNGLNYYRTSLIISIGLFIATILVLTCIMIKLLSKKNKSFLSTTIERTGISREISQDSSIQRSRPPSYRSLPPPSYENATGFTTWWRSLTNVSKNEANVEASCQNEASGTSLTNDVEQTPSLDVDNKVGSADLRPKAITPSAPPLIKEINQTEVTKMLQNTNKTYNSLS